MSQPLLFVNPDDGLVYKVTGREVVELSRLDEQIANTEAHLENLRIEREKFVELSGQATAEATAETPAEASQTPAQPEQPVVPNDNPPAQPETPVDSVPTDQPISDNQGEAVASTETQLPVDATPSDQPVAPAIAA